MSVKERLEEDIIRWGTTVPIPTDGRIELGVNDAEALMVLIDAAEGLDSHFERAGITKEELSAFAKFWSALKAVVK